MTTQAAKELIAKHLLHVEQVTQGLIPADSPPTFTLPEGDDALVDGLPWWFGPDYHPTPEALAAAERGDTESPTPAIEKSQTSAE